MTNIEIKENIKKEVKRVLFYAYKTSETFPSSCGLVAGLLARIIYLKNLLPEYNIYYIRGLHLSRYEISDECNFCRSTKGVPCNNCKEECLGVEEHSWIEIIKKNTKERIILDYTSIQFDEEAILFEECLYNEDFDENKLYDFMEENSYFLLTEDNENFQNYIPCYKQVLNGEEVETSIQIMNEYYKREL